MVNRDQDRLSETVNELAENSSRVSTHAFDIRDDSAVEKLVESIPEKYGSLDYAL